MVRFFGFLWCAGFISGAFVLAGGWANSVYAAETTSVWDAPGLLEMLPDGGPNAASWMKSARLNFGGWFDGGYTYNPGNPGDKINI